MKITIHVHVLSINQSSIRQQEYAKFLTARSKRNGILTSKNVHISKEVVNDGKNTTSQMKVASLNAINTKLTSQTTTHVVVTLLIPSITGRLGSVSSLSASMGRDGIGN